MNLATQMMLAPAWRCSGRNNDEMVDRFVEGGLISSKDVEDAFRAIPRGAFVPSDQFDEAYFDSPLRGDPHVHMSAPHMYATIMEALDLCPGLSFLNIGSGTGYFSCLVGYLTKRNSINHAIEQHAELVDYCKERCEEFMRYSPTVAHEMSQPVVLTGNCFRLDHRDRQYDRIYCGAACPPNKVPFILSMTKVGGFAIIPCKNKLLKIDRVSPTGVKQSVIREVSFASLAPLPNSEASQPKLKFPPTGDKKKHKSLKVYPPSDLLVSNGTSRKTLARLRALQKASECLRSSEPLPLPFCYIPDELQLKELKASKKIREMHKSHSNESQTCSSVDSKIAFFGPCSGQSVSHGMDSTDTWDFLNSDKLWENVVEHYYSMCSITKGEKLKALLLYVRKKASKHSTSVRTPSYADLMSKLGLLVDSPKEMPSTVESNSENVSTTDNETSCSPSDNNTTANDGSSSGHTLSSIVSSECSAVVHEPKSDVKLSQQNSVSLQSEENIKAADSESVAPNPVTEAKESLESSSSSFVESCTPNDSNMSSPVESVTKESEILSQSQPTKEPLGATDLPASTCNDPHAKSKIPKDGKKCCCSETNRRRTSPEYINVLLEVDRSSMKKLNSFPKKSWCLEDDKELVRFLSDVSDQSSKGRCKGWFKPELVRPSLFSRLDSLAYPRLASTSAEDLAFRTVVLCRIASLLDSSLYLLTGSSLLKDFNTSKSKYPMDSFNEASFESSRNSNNVTFEQLPVDIKQKPKEESFQFGVMDADQLRVQLELTSKKLKLTQDLQDQIKEQQKVLRKQASLLEEKQLLVQNLNLLDIHRHAERSQTSEPQLVVELKTQRQEVLSRIQKLVDQHASQETKKADLVEELKQVNEERCRALQFKSRKKETTESSTTTVEKEQPSEPPITTTTMTHNDDSKPSSSCTSSRYQIADLLPHLRFLLPLCRQRWRLVQEMLHASEHSAPDHMPIVTVDRRTPLNERAGRPECSVLLQVYKELRPEGLNYRWNKWKYDQWWEVKFVGEGIIDQGGGFRDSLIEIADEICPPEKGSTEVLPFFIRTPNNKDGVGDYQDAYIPTTLSKQWCIYEWIGKLFGAVYRTDENLTVSCPPYFWKLLVGEHVTWARDYADIDESVVRFTDALEVSDEELYDAAYGVDCTFSTVLSDGSRVDLVPDGENVVVKSGDRQRFATLLREARMTESVKQVLAIRKGLISVVPESVLRLLTWAELERGVCGNPDVSLSVLKSACKYGDDLSESTECIKHFWLALSKFTNDERSRFLRFVTGRRRPPAPFTVVKAGGSNELPNASTCASSLFWPNYPSSAIATARLRYAIYNCIAIDTDTSPW